MLLVFPLFSLLPPHLGQVGLQPRNGKFDPVPPTNTHTRAATVADHGCSAASRSSEPVWSLTHS